MIYHLNLQRGSIDRIDDVNFVHSANDYIVNSYSEYFFIYDELFLRSKTVVNTWFRIYALTRDEVEFF